MGAWHYLVLSAGQPPAHNIPFKGGGSLGEAEVRILFYGHEDFSESILAFFARNFWNKKRLGSVGSPDFEQSESTRVEFLLARA